MIGRLCGVLVWKQPPDLMIDVSGVGYELEASLTTFQRLPEVGSDVVLFTHLAVREDAQMLYGFADTHERTLFRSLIRISGVGARLALLILSGMSVEQFGRCVREGDTAALVRLPGIGKKTAERLMIEMRDRVGQWGLGKTGVILSGEPLAPIIVNPAEDAISALVALGYKLPEASRMVQSLDVEGLDSEAIIRLALQGSVRSRS
ncbi:MAG: Holliday junction branch migration protein RuvA [Candidatus Contendobacter odensis]|uniref:Holliday junction branch migration complex subunit RuvA n=1 Tax=Candidatus Contendibacter odensensis TaxID=1400860 RepID=A0A2G6PEZ3_9GAMM|nr:MAG: Holliday junction branch migration protein RuvA [Candidatus Contendobacter odensis]